MTTSPSRGTCTRRCSPGRATFRTGRRATRKTSPACSPSRGTCTRRCSPVGATFRTGRESVTGLENAVPEPVEFATTFATGRRTTSTSSYRPTSPTRSRSRTASSPGTSDRSSSSTSRRPKTGTTMPTEPRSPPSASLRGASSFSASFATMTATATGAASRPRQRRFPTSASRPNAAGAAPTRPAPRPPGQPPHRAGGPMTRAHRRATRERLSPGIAERFNRRRYRLESQEPKHEETAEPAPTS